MRFSPLIIILYHHLPQMQTLVLLTWQKSYLRETFLVCHQVHFRFYFQTLNQVVESFSSSYFTQCYSYLLFPSFLSCKTCFLNSAWFVFKNLSENFLSSVRIMFVLCHVIGPFRSIHFIGGVVPLLLASIMCVANHGR